MDQDEPTWCLLHGVFVRMKNKAHSSVSMVEVWLISQHENNWVCDSCAFPWALFVLVVCLSNSSRIDFVLSYYFFNILKISALFKDTNIE